MSLNFLLVLIVPTLVLLVSFFLFERKYTLGHVFLQFGIQVVVCLIAFLITFNWSLYDTEVWNGQVTDKKSVQVHCRHSYPCNCHTVDCGKNCETTVCDTCYEHPYDIDWDVYTNIDETITINPIDSQGLQEPPRWAQVKIGEPVCAQKMYVNYIKANKDNLMIPKGVAKSYLKDLVGYPLDIYDYYHLKRIINKAGSIKVDDSWNSTLEDMLSKLGPTKRCNIVVLFVRNMNPQYFYAMKEHWINGKKNDIIPVISLDDKDKIQWVEVMTLSTADMARIKIRDDLKAMGILDKDKFFTILNTDIQNYYKHVSMKNYKYLEENRALSTGQLIFLLIFSFVISIGLSIFFVKECPEED